MHFSSITPRLFSAMNARVKKHTNTIALLIFFIICRLAPIFPLISVFFSSFTVNFFDTAAALTVGRRGVSR